MKKSLGRCNLARVATLALVRYQNIGRQTKGCLFLGEDYLCDTLECMEKLDTRFFTPDIAIPTGTYKLDSRRLRRVSLGGGYYGRGETRIYIRDANAVTWGRLTYDAIKTHDGNIAVGTREGGLTHIGDQLLNNTDMCLDILSRILAKLDYALLYVCHAKQDELNGLFLHPLWNKGFTLADLTDTDKRILRDPFNQRDTFPTLESLISIANLY